MRVVAGLILAGAVFGHDLYLKPAKWTTAPRESLRLEYHSGDTFPVSEHTVVLERLKDAKTVFAGGESACTEIRNESEMMTVARCTAAPAGHFYLLSRTTPNFIELEPAKFEEYLEHEGLKYVSEYRKNNAESQKPGREMYSKYVKSLLVAGSGSEYFRQRLNQPIEFVPAEDPYAVKPGGQIRVLLLFRGKPAPGHEVELQVAAGGKVERKILGNTDSDGMIAVPVTAGGFHKLHAIVMERLPAGQKADWESFWATLTFGTR